MVSQLIFGECCEILEQTKDQWCRIRATFDGYEGWCTDSHLTEIDENEFETGIAPLIPDWVTALEYNGHPMMVPMGSHLTAMKNGRALWRKNTVHYKGKIWEPDSSTHDAKAIRQLTYKFLNIPYLWGGKSVFGFDCSGFVQTVYKFLGVPVLRDAHQQATQGEGVGFLEETRTGDLAFFDNEAGNITHVGILLNAYEIIHASGKVRIDKIDNMGIVRSEDHQRTHHLRTIRRLLLEK
ncbi:hydrolase Nlp/P60 [Puia dinghuensis]|uniref:Hydrolase Nlp/P60 n=2 Tax=Puia dinghuensis TaxID=1792502 RepID=A0A8J2UC56_9BACT|nr:hydrolase Nlp/P60 [Puia dinghuensis]